MDSVLDIRFEIRGDAVPKGNHAGFPIARGKCTECKPGARCKRRNCFGGTIVGCVITDDRAKELEVWEGLIRVEAVNARNKAGCRLVTRPGAVELSMVFLVERPASHWTSKGKLSSDGQRKPLPTTKPDNDKVGRAIADGLIGAIVEDDSQFADTKISKVWAPHAGVLIHVRHLAGLEEDSWVARELAAHRFQFVPAQGALL